MMGERDTHGIKSGAIQPLWMLPLPAMGVPIMAWSCSHLSKGASSSKGLVLVACGCARVLACWGLSLMQQMAVNFTSIELSNKWKTHIRIGVKPWHHCWWKGKLHIAFLFVPGYSSLRQRGGWHDHGMGINLPNICIDILEYIAMQIASCTRNCLCWVTPFCFWNKFCANVKASTCFCVLFHRGGLARLQLQIDAETLSCSWVHSISM